MSVNKTIVKILLVGWGLYSIPSAAQQVTVSVTPDSTFHAGDDKGKTFKGFDVDTSKVNVVNIAMQLAQDAQFNNTNDESITNALPTKSFYRQRVDLMLSSALPEHTNVYATFSFMNTTEGMMSDPKVVVANLEVEQFFKKNLKIRIGRLANSVSESQFFGRMALEESSAHVLGRKIFINDAIELDGMLTKYGPTFFTGLKPVFKPFNLKAAYLGLYQPFNNGLQMHTIFSVNRQFADDMVNYIPDFTGKDAYFSYEAELSYKQKASTVFANIGGNLGYVGLIPHASSTFDFIKQIKPVVTRKGDSFKETFTTSAGFRLYPARINRKCMFRQIGVEAELQGAATSRFTALNACAYFKMALTRRMILTYYCTPAFIWQNYNENKPKYIGGVVNFLRLSIVVGNPARLFM